MDYERHLLIAEKLSGTLDEQFQLGPWKFGLDPLIGLVPVVGDVLPLLVSLYILWIGQRLGVPEKLIHKMIANALVDLVLGVIPVVGDVSDFFWKSNTRNIRLLRRHLKERPTEGRIVAENLAILD